MPSTPTRSATSLQPGRGGDRRLGVARAQHAERRTQVGQRLAADLLDVAEGLARLLRVGVLHVGGDAGLDVDGDQRVGDHVVQVAGDAQPLLVDAAPGLLLAGPLGGLGPLDQGVLVGAAVVHRGAEREREARRPGS